MGFCGSCGRPIRLGDKADQCRACYEEWETVRQAFAKTCMRCDEEREVTLCGSCCGRYCKKCFAGHDCDCLPEENALSDEEVEEIVRKVTGKREKA